MSDGRYGIVCCLNCRCVCMYYHLPHNLYLRSHTGIDNGVYGVDEASAGTECDHKDLEFDCKDSIDPLSDFPFLKRVRDNFMLRCIPEYVDAIPNDMPVKDVTAFHRFGKQVQDYIHFKKTNDQLLM